MKSAKKAKTDTQDKLSAMQKILKPMDIKSTPKNFTKPAPKTLLIRFSSLGDVILSLSAARALSQKDFDFVTSQEFGSLLEGHPGLNQLFLLKRKKSHIETFRDLWKLAQELTHNHYDQVIDLHNSLRSRVLRLFLWSLNTSHGRTKGHVRLRVKVVKKQRLLRFLSLLCRGIRVVSPKPWVERFAQLGGNSHARPKLGYLLVDRAAEKSEDATHAKIKFAVKTDLLIMPGSKWPAKRLSQDIVVAVVSMLLAQNPKWVIGVLGAKNDELSERLVRAISQKGQTILDLTGDYDYKDLANLLASSRGLLSADTGFAHLAEGLGIPVLTLYGPTSPSLGFAPYLDRSQALVSSLWCSPCSKDGSRCLRPIQKYKCMENFSGSELRDRITEMLK